jgi:SAM-dependent methyltransferase
MNFSLEDSPTPIYSRIIHCLANSLVALGHKAQIDAPSRFTSVENYLQELERNQIEFSLVTNLSGLTASFIENEERFVFEKIPHKLIFLHHDHCATCREDLLVAHLIRAFLRVSNRSYHFCIEKSNCEDLIELGLRNVYFTHHATEFNSAPCSANQESRISFVGHALEATSETQPSHHWLKRDYWSRVCDLTYHVQPRANEFADRLSSQEDFVPWFATKSNYLLALHRHSLYMRGDILKRIGSNAFHIYGGDPGYLHGLDLDRRLQGENFIYHPATSDPSETARIYNSSIVSINITPFQFDTAVINRVLDIGAAGGFPLTDWKEDLAMVTTANKEISYRNPEELQYKIDYYCHPDHLQERLEISHCLLSEITAKYSYKALVSYLLSKIQTEMIDAPSYKDLVKVDLGCGINKPQGFIGVDQFASPLVDKVADLTRRFPFASSSVDYVRAHDVIEHLPGRIHTMNEIWRICKNQAVVDIRVPSSDGRGAFQDPTHVSYWNANSFFYYTAQYPAYFQLCQTYGFKGEYEIISLDEEVSIDKVVHLRVQLKAIKHDDIKNGERGALLAELRTLNVLLSAKEFTDENYESLKGFIKETLSSPNCSELTVMIGSEDISNDGMASILTQLMLELIMEESCTNEKGFPNLIPVPKAPHLLKLIEPRLTYQGSLEAESIKEVYALL